jgi:hypothetical protein
VRRRPIGRVADGDHQTELRPAGAAGDLPAAGFREVEPRRLYSLVAVVTGDVRSQRRCLSIRALPLDAE